MDGALVAAIIGGVATIVAAMIGRSRGTIPDQTPRVQSHAYTWWALFGFVALAAHLAWIVSQRYPWEAAIPALVVVPPVTLSLSVFAPIRWTRALTLVFLIHFIGLITLMAHFPNPRPGTPDAFVMAVGSANAVV